ncbi:MAG TPA: hydrogenase formation protein HypD [Clostridia bacterium]|nr:hydrogenase formation protein HypD [Clostridia bacterium]
MARSNNLKDLACRIRNYNGRPLKIMEVCGTHTAQNFKLGIRSLLPEGIRLISGPGCPVCVTPVGYIDRAVELSQIKKVIVCSFGDLLRVPGSKTSLYLERARGADVRMVYSPLDALEIAVKNPDREIVFLSVGFETTVPASCLTVRKAKERGIKNFSALCSNKTMTRAYYLLKDCADAFLLPGHVSAITGMAVYQRLKADGISGAVAGFTSADLLTALCAIIEKSASGEPFAVNCYPRVVADEGNPAAMKLIGETMKECDAWWRGIGMIPGSGLMLGTDYEEYDARIKFSLGDDRGEENPGCRCGEVLKGTCEPPDCPFYAGKCTPENPLGACMVSSEGTCAAFYKYSGGNESARHS